MSRQIIDPLLESFTLKNLRLRNRVVSTSHEPSYTEDGMPKDRYRLYHVEKAKGGIGLTMMGGSAVVAPDSPAAFGNLHVYKDEIVPWLRELAYDVHEHGAGGDVPDHPPGPPHEQLRRRLAAGRVPVAAPRARAPRLPEGGRGMGHGPHRAGLRRRHRALPRSRPGRHRARGLHASAGRLLVAADQPPRGRVRRQPRGPAALPASGDPRGPRGGGPGLRRRHPDVVRRGHARRTPPRGGADDRGSGRRRGHRLHQRDPGMDGERRGAVAGHPADGHSGGAAPGVRGRDQARGGRAGDARQPDQRCRHRPPRHPRRAARPRRDDPRAHRRPAHRRENSSGRRGSDPAVCRSQLLP